MSAGGQECKYCENDQAAREDCLRTLDPRQTVECSTDFNSVTQCSSVCVEKWALLTFSWVPEPPQKAALSVENSAAQG